MWRSLFFLLLIPFSLSFADGRHNTILELNIPRYGGGSYACRKTSSLKSDFGFIRKAKWHRDDSATLRRTIQKKLAEQQKRKKKSGSHIKELQRALKQLDTAIRKCNKFTQQRKTPTPKATIALTPAPIRSAGPTATPTIVSSTVPTPLPSPTVTPLGVYTSSITQHGITWTFDKAYRCGKFMNGDWWVVGPVTLVATSPEFTGQRHGFELNPASPVRQGFDNRVADFDVSLVPTLPATIPGGTSIVKSISVNPTAPSCKPCLQSAAVLTVLSTEPMTDGAHLFRPPYFGTDKTLRFGRADIQLQALPKIDPQNIQPISLDTVERSFARMWLEHKMSASGRIMRPIDNVPWYDASGDVLISTAVLRFLLDTPDDPTNAMIAFIQNGIDHYEMLRGGSSWASEHGRRLLFAATAVLLGSDELANELRSAPLGTFEEDGNLFYSPRADGGRGAVLYGDTSTEGAYWSHAVTGSFSKTLRDPYGYVDGGWKPGDGYQFCCLAQPYKYIALVQKLVPQLAALFPTDFLVQYANRWDSVGMLAQPDPCAPPDPRDIASKRMDYYGVTYGPNPSVPGDCIYDTDPSDGIGRGPENHGLSRGAGHYGNGFGNELWQLYGTP